MKTLLLIDAHSIIHRAYHALPPLTSPNGTPTGALYGVARILSKVLSEKKPDYVAAAFDLPGPTFRKKEYSEYKAHRPPADDALISQLIEARTLFKIFGVTSFEKEGFEADDIIGTLAEKFSEKVKILILTGDLDSLQLISENVSVETFKKGVSETVLYDTAAVISRFGILPKQVPDMKGLAGDPSDNIPGVRGVGPKTAALLLKRFETIEDFFESNDQEKKFAAIREHKEDALLSKRLATIRRDVPISVSIEDLLIHQDSNTHAEYMKTLGFSSLLKGGLHRENSTVSPKKMSQATLDVIVSPPEKIDGTLVGNHIKEYAKTHEIDGTLFDIDVAVWLLNPEKNDETQNYTTHEDAYRILKKKMKDLGVLEVFENIEMPIIPALAFMENKGICVDEKSLLALQKEIITDTTRIEGRIYEIAGETFNPNSPQQVSKILFEKLMVGKGRKRKTKTGMNSTSERALAGLRKEHEIVERILEYRENMKILSTYVDPLIQLSKNGGGIIHTSFIQTGAATGRFSSEKPNLQNIPQESKWAKSLRDCFVARNGKNLVSFDYSQLELRILAHVSGDKLLRAAFIQKKDIHTLTAKNVFNVNENDVTPQMRRIAKTLNFGVIYGMGPKAFSEESGISVDDAKKFINEYFTDFSMVNTWRTQIKELMEKEGCVKNENGRIRYFPYSKKNPRAAAEFERAAINMPIQSLEADIIKLAIRDVFLLITQEYKEKCSLLLTIHDELILEISDDILKEATARIKTVMEGVYKLSVPLVVEAKKGERWGSMEKIGT